MSTFLSDAWFTELRDRLAAGPPAPPGSPNLGIGQVVTGLPDGSEKSWTIVFRPAGTDLFLDSLEEADVVLVESYESATDLATGRRSVSELLSAGDLKLRGDARRLKDAAPLLEPVLAALGAPVMP